ncbi:DNA polymerase III subunit beta [Agrobacterium rhizogenes]|nr:DNA polymerase III subunit beta [Rhizobium rhizogenes]
MFVTEKPALADALALVAGIVKAKSKFPILANVLIERDGDALTARCSNFNLEIATRFAATIGEEFLPFTVEAQRFADIVKAAPEDRIAVNVIHQDGVMAAITVNSGRSRLKLPVLPASDFPKLDAGNLPHRISLNAPTLQKVLKAVEYAAETNQAKYYICGVSLQPDATGLVAVATDGRRLAKRLIPANEFDQDDLAGIPPVIVPSETVDQIIKLLEGRDDVTAEWSGEKIRVELSDTVLTSKLIDGQFPQWQLIQPDPACITAQFSGKALSEALGRMLLVTPDAGNGILFDFANGALSLRARDIAAGEGEDEIAAEADGEIRSGFHGRHLREAIAHHDGDSFELLIGKGAAPALLRQTGDTSDYTILMPMQVKGMLVNG